MQLRPHVQNDYFLGNLFFLTEKFGFALTYYLKAARVIEAPKFLRRLVYSVFKAGALFEGVLLYSLSDPEFRTSKVKGILRTLVPPKQLTQFLFDNELIEFMIELYSPHDQIALVLSQLIASPERSQTALTAALRQSVRAQLLDFLHFSKD